MYLLAPFFVILIRFLLDITIKDLRTLNINHPARLFIDIRPTQQSTGKVAAIERRAPAIKRYAACAPGRRPPGKDPPPRY
ncbi:hypothetical protein MNBD_DELTA01-1989 [hydrothermal vent metagenome]|uniref:Uncharacterized protein n=1 Tax=hydrothermal vent metagenome TaxID=652676 RepID=A0A3B0RHS5_9ZZZZ